MANFSSVNDLIESMAQRSERITVLKRTDETPSLTYSAGNIGSTWTNSGFPTAGAVPTTAAIPTKATTGALADFTNPGAGETLRLIDVEAISQNTPFASLYLYDRLVHMGGLVGNSTSVQTVNTPALTRGDTTGAGVVGFLEFYTNLGGTPATFTVTYTNSFGVTGRTGTVVSPSVQTCKIAPIVLQTGDIGIRSIESVQLSVSTGTAGNFGVTMGRRICGVPCLSSGTFCTVNQKQGVQLGFPTIDIDACLWLVLGPSGASSSDGEVSIFFTLARTG